ncbi:MAG TPA: C13 family peptidase [Vicinamibacterales bacterium]
MSLLRVFASSWLVVLCVSTPALAQQTYLLVITGAPGDDEHATKFQQWAKTFIDTARTKDSVPASNVTLLSGSAAAKATVEKAFTDIAAKTKPNDELFVLLIGHGSFDGTTAAFNIPGPDLTADDYARILSKFSGQRVVFVNTASSSGAFLKPLAGPGRVIVTSTKTGGERNEPDFPQYFVEAFGNDAADRDRNGHVSVGEAFEYAKARVVEAFQKKGLLLTEHATLDDGSEGQLASSVFLGGGQGRSALQVDTNDPELKALADQRDAIDRQITELRAKKATMDQAKYDAEMEKLLTALALKTKEIRDLQAKKK